MIEEVFLNQGYFAALCIALRLGLSLQDAEERVGSMRLAKMNQHETMGEGALYDDAVLSEQRVAEVNPC